MPRPIFETQERCKQSLVFQATMSDDIRCLHCCMSCIHPCSSLCVPLVSDIAKDSTYVHIHENRIEYNYPSMTFTWNCNCNVIDDIHVIYFDRPHMNQVYSLTGCCCGYEKTIVLRQPLCACANVTAGCCGRICLPCIEDKDEFITKMVETRTERCKEKHIPIEVDMDRTA